MKRELKEKWIVDLTSGKYKQAKGRLKEWDGDGYCCLGVLCKTANIEFNPKDDTVVGGGNVGPISYRYSPLQALIDPSGRMDLRYFSNRNDGTFSEQYNPMGHKFSFPDLARWIKENVPEED